jgi:hypothetical protein
MGQLSSACTAPHLVKVILRRGLGEDTAAAVVFVFSAGNNHLLLLDDGFDGQLQREHRGVAVQVECESKRLETSFSLLHRPRVETRRFQAIYG